MSSEDFNLPARDTRESFSLSKLKKKVNDLVGDIGLTKFNAELFPSMIKSPINWPRKRCKRQVREIKTNLSQSFYTLGYGICFCNNVPGLFGVILVPFGP